MAPFLLFLFFYLYLSLPLSVSAGPIASGFLHPNFTGSYYHYIEHSGVFLVSPNATFALAFYKPSAEASLFYLSILHYPSDTPVWTANPSSALPSSFLLFFTDAGLSLMIPNSNSNAVWSTPSLTSSAASLLLLDSGELQLLDSINVSLWSSFSQPTDTILPGQTLPAGASLISAMSNIDLAPGPYRLLVTSSNALLQWSTGNNSFVSYWALSLDVRATTNSNKQVAYLSVNSTGLYLISSNATNSVVTGFHFPPPTSNKEIRFVKLDASGQLHVMSYYLANNSKKPTSDLGTLLVAPISQCDLPFTCKALGLCSDRSNGLRCSCPSNFGATTDGGCEPADGLVLPSCGSSLYQQSSITYVSLGVGIDYFANKFVSPDPSIDDLLLCENICSGNCSCLGFFYQNSSKACYLLEHKLGTLLTSNTEDYSSVVGYVKTMRRPSNQTQTNHSSSFSTIFLIVLLPCVAGILGIILLYRALMKWYKGIPIGRTSNKYAGTAGFVADHDPSTSVKYNSEKEEDIPIPGLPTRFSYSDLETATVNFRMHIGSGGFGSVYKGILPDKTIVAVKRMANVGKQARHEFLTEIAIISNIRHINLVKLRGFCAEGNHRMLVYEYMNRGSLDQPLFKLNPPLDWSERLQIAIGAAHGLAYLHSGCNHKIIHCDVKPENILLDDQKGIKIADFGLAKLIAPDQSSLFTTLRGTRGYLAPEWLTNSSITDKTDVYSFGMVLLELVHGRKNWSEGSWCKPAFGTKTTNHYFPMTALKKHEEGRYGELIDPRIEQKVDKEEIERVIKVALCCLHEEPCFRPSMRAVAAMLEGSILVWEPRVESLHHHLSRYEKGFMGMDKWGSNQLLNEKTGTESEKPACCKSNSTKNVCNLPSYLSAEQMSGPR